MGLEERYPEARRMEFKPQFANLGGGAEALSEYAEKLLIEFTPIVVVEIEVELANRRGDECEGAWVESSRGKVAEGDRLELWKDRSTIRRGG